MSAIVTVAVTAAVIVALITIMLSDAMTAPAARRSAQADAAAPAPQPTATAEQPALRAAPRGWTLAWSDEFDGPRGALADPEKWNYETGGSGWGNDELQYYTDSSDNASLDGAGNLVITARRIDPSTTDLQCWYGPCQYTSARLNTAGDYSFQYGRIEARAQMPAGGGLWPAIWALGDDIGSVGWPQSGEIDVMEWVGNRPEQVFGTIHGPGYSGGEAFGGFRDFGSSQAGRWHEFAVEWMPGLIVWEVDGVTYHTAKPADVAPDQWTFDHPFWLLTNMAIGGNFGGPLADDVQFPQSLVVDYVRVYRLDEGS